MGMDRTRTRVRIAAIVMVTLLAMPMATTAAKAEKVTLTAPNGGERWAQGGTYNITWITAGAAPSALTRMVMTPSSSIQATPDSGSRYTWSPNGTW